MGSGDAADSESIERCREQARPDARSDARPALEKEAQITRIVVLAWGSLVWDPRDLQAAAEFAPNGPLLPIEFCRISADGRLTLAVDETFGANCTTYSAPSALQSLNAAIENLSLREGMRNTREVGFIELASGKQSQTALQRHPEAVASIAALAASNGCDAAIWTALASKFRRARQRRGAILRHRGDPVSRRTGRTRRRQ